MTVTVFGVTYTMTGAPVFVRYTLTRLIARWRSSNFSATPRSVQHYVHNLGVRFGV